MKKLLLVAIVGLQSLLWGSSASAAMCEVGTVIDYVRLGSLGCTIGEFAYTNFTLQQGAADDLSRRTTGPEASLLPGSSGFTTITVTPIVEGNTIVGLTFGLSPNTASDGSLYNAMISYQITSTSGARVLGSTLTLNGSSSTGDGSGTAIANFCLGGVFEQPDLIDGCNGQDTAVLVTATGGAEEDSISFGGLYATLQVTDDIALDSGGFGSGSSTVNSFSNRFLVTPSVVPEPESVLLLGVGLLAFGLARRRTRPAASARR